MTGHSKCEHLSRGQRHVAKPAHCRELEMASHCPLGLVDVLQACVPLPRIQRRVERRCSSGLHHLLTATGPSRPLSQWA